MKESPENPYAVSLDQLESHARVAPEDQVEEQADEREEAPRAHVLTPWHGIMSTGR